MNYNAHSNHSNLTNVTISSNAILRTTSSKPEQVTELGFELGFEQNKDGGIMGGDWRKVISRKRRGATCSVEVISRLKPTFGAVVHKEERHFCTGSFARGEVDALGIEGECVYSMEHDVSIDGDMHDGQFNGVGTVIYPSHGRVDGMFHHGALTPATYTFDDGLVFEQTNWKYCSSCLPLDRRFQQEIKFGLRPVCTTMKTQQQPTRTIPEGCYDTGDGFYSPKTRCVTSERTGQIIRIPTETEASWIMKYCRRAWDENAGFRPNARDSFTEDDVNYAPLLMEKRRRSILHHQISVEEMKTREEICKRMFSVISG